MIHALWKNRALYFLELAELSVMQIFVRTLMGRTYTIEIEPSDTIATLKEKLQDKSSILRSYMRIIFAGKVLQDDKTLEEYNVQKESTIHMIIKFPAYVEIVFSLPGQFVTVSGERHDTIWKLKKKVGRTLNIPQEQQIFMFNKIPLNNDQTLKELGFFDMTTNNENQPHIVVEIDPLVNTTVSVVLPGNNLQKFDICLGEATEVLKSQIEERTRIPVRKQSLFNRTSDKVMNNKTSLSDHFIHGNSLIDLLVLLQIEVVLPSGEKTKLKGDSNQRVGDIKAIISQQCSSVKLSKQCIFYEGIEMLDYMTLAEYAIYDDVTLELSYSDNKSQATSLPGRLIGSLRSKFLKLNRGVQADMTGDLVDWEVTQSDLESDHIAVSKHTIHKDQSTQFNFLIHFIGSFSQLKIDKGSLFVFDRSEGGSRFWRDHGIEVSVPKEAIPPNVTSLEVAVVPVIEGSFIFPFDTIPVSAVYAIGVSCPLIQPVIVSIQHCVELTEISECDQLSFVKAEHIDMAPPYTFSRLHYPGVFTVGSEYGNIITSEFTLYAIVRESISRMVSRFRNPVPPRYKLLTFYEHDAGTCIWTVHFIVTKNISSHIQNVTAEMKREGLVRKRELVFTFNEPEICIEAERETIDGWKIQPAQSPCKIFQEDVDSYSYYNGELPKISVDIIADRHMNHDSIFTHQFNVIGTTETSAFISVTFDCHNTSPVLLSVSVPESRISTDGSQRCSPITYLAIHPPTLASLMKEVAKPAPDQWKNIARQLRLEEPRISAIDMEHRGRPDDCFSAVFDYWEKAETCPYSWETIVEALRYVDRLDIVENIVKNY